MRLNKPKCQSLEQGKVYCRTKEEGSLCSKNSNSHMGFHERVFTGEIWSDDWWACNFLLIGGWWGNRVVFQESCAHPPGWGPQFLQKNSDLLLCMPLEEEPGPCFITVVLFPFKTNFFFFFKFLFGCAESSLLHGLFSNCGESGLLSSWGAWALHGLLITVASFVAENGL